MVQRFDSYLFRSRTALPAPAQAEIDAISAVMPKVVAWRRDFHQHPELGNEETLVDPARFAALQAIEHLLQRDGAQPEAREPAGRRMRRRRPTACVS